MTQARTYTLLGPDRRPYRSATPGKLGGNKRSRIYGRLDCPSALRAIARGGYVEDRVFFADEATAVEAGYRPCAVCLPDQYAEWKARAGGKPRARAQEGRMAASAGASGGPVGRLLAKIDAAWADLQASYAGLSERELTEPGVTGDWSARDILAHVTTWEEEALKYLPLIAQGGRPPRYATYGGIDAFNARMTEQKRHLSPSEVLRQLDETHRRLLDCVRSAPEGQLVGQTRFRRRLRLDTYGHYPMHARAIREWRERRAGE